MQWLSQSVAGACFPACAWRGRPSNHPFASLLQSHWVRRRSSPMGQTCTHCNLCTGINGVADVARCKQAGQLLQGLPKTETIADGLQVGVVLYGIFNSVPVYPCIYYFGSLVCWPCTRRHNQAQLGSLTWPVVRDLVDAVVTVTEQEIVHAMQLCFERLKVVVEPSGAVGLAAVLSQQFASVPQLDGCKRVGIVLCGGNADLEGCWASWGPHGASCAG